MSLLARIFTGIKETLFGGGILKFAVKLLKLGVLGVFNSGLTSTLRAGQKEAFDYATASIGIV